MQQLKYIDSVVACGSITEASRRCFVTQPSMTEAIHSLEEELRMAIFTRRGIELSPCAAKFVSSLREAATSK